jgi:hypothetical protein
MTGIKLAAALDAGSKSSDCSGQLLHNAAAAVKDPGRLTFGIVTLSPIYTF